MAETNHTRVFLDINFSNKIAPDTLYIELTPPFDSEYLQTFKFSDSITGDSKKRFFCIPKNDFDEPSILKFGLGGKWNNEIIERNPSYGYGFTREEIRMVGTAGLYDSIPNDFQNGPTYTRGFPYVDTLTLNF